MAATPILPLVGATSRCDMANIVTFVNICKFSG